MEKEKELRVALFYVHDYSRTSDAYFDGFYKEAYSDCKSKHKECDLILLFPKTRLILFSDKDFAGDNYIIDNKDDIDKKIKCAELPNFTFPNNIRSLIVTDYVDDKMENFDALNSTMVKNGCHYVCSSINYMNVAAVLLVIVFIYFYFA